MQDCSFLFEGLAFPWGNASLPLEFRMDAGVHTRADRCGISALFEAVGGAGNTDRSTK